MNYPVLIAIALFFLMVMEPAAAAQDDDILTQVSNLSLSVPEKGNAPLGSQESMTQMLDWLNETATVLLSFFQGIMDILGLGNMSYTKQMTDTLNQGISLSQGYR